MYKTKVFFRKEFDTKKVQITRNSVVFTQYLLTLYDQIYFKWY